LIPLPFPFSRLCLARILQSFYLVAKLPAMSRKATNKIDVDWGALAMAWDDRELRSKIVALSLFHGPSFIIALGRHINDNPVFS
jgi:hypothetical protein